MEPAHDRPLRLLQVLGYASGPGEQFGITGVERVVQLLVEGLPATRYEHSLAYPEKGRLSAFYRERVRQVLAIESRHRYDPRYVRALSRFIEQHGIDLVLTHGLRVDFQAALACRKTRVPHIVCRAGQLADDFMHPVRRWVYGLVDTWTLRSCRSVLTVSQTSKRRLRQTQHVPEHKIEVIVNGIRTPRVSEDERRAARRDLGVGDTEFLVGGVGRLVPLKSFDVLVQSLAMLGQEKNVVGVLLGDGPERSRLERLALEHQVRLLLPGHQPNPYPLIAALDIAVLPSKTEGMPLAVLESMALGVATVATAVGGTTELIQEGRTGLLVPWGDAGALAAALRRLLENDERRHHLAAAGAKHVQERFNLETMLAAFDTYLMRTAGWQAS